jgi:hypothetical protein
LTSLNTPVKVKGKSAKENRMRNRWLVIIVCILLVDVGLLGQAKKPRFVDGNVWQGLGDSQEALKEKIAFINGLQQGSQAIAFYMATRASKASKSISQSLYLAVYENIQDFDLTGTPYDQIVKGVGQLYKDDANKGIPVFAIANLANKRIRGLVTEEEVSEELSWLRSRKWIPD